MDCQKQQTFKRVYNRAAAAGGALRRKRLSREVGYPSLKPALFLGFATERLLAKSPIGGSGTLGPSRGRTALPLGPDLRRLESSCNHPRKAASPKLEPAVQSRLECQLVFGAVLLMIEILHHFIYIYRCTILPGFLYFCYMRSM